MRAPEGGLQGDAVLVPEAQVSRIQVAAFIAEIDQGEDSVASRDRVGLTAYDHRAGGVGERRLVRTEQGRGRSGIDRLDGEIDRPDQGGVDLVPRKRLGGDLERPQARQFIGRDREARPRQIGLPVDPVGQDVGHAPSCGRDLVTRHEQVGRRHAGLREQAQSQHQPARVCIDLHADQHGGALARQRRYLAQRIHGGREHQSVLRKRAVEVPGRHAQALPRGGDRLQCARRDGGAAQPGRDRVGRVSAASDCERRDGQPRRWHPYLNDMLRSGQRLAVLDDHVRIDAAKSEAADRRAQRAGRIPRLGRTQHAKAGCSDNIGDVVGVQRRRPDAVLHRLEDFEQGRCP